MRQGAPQSSRQRVAQLAQAREAGPRVLRARRPRRNRHQALQGNARQRRDLLGLTPERVCFAELVARLGWLLADVDLDQNRDTTVVAVQVLKATADGASQFQRV